MEPRASKEKPRCSINSTGTGSSKRAAPHRERIRSVCSTLCGGENKPRVI